MNDFITLQLDVFEGPLDLLLYLIKKNDLEISTISISQVTEQYLEYLESLEKIDIDNVSDFLFMAAELAFIKSKMLLPKTDDEEETDVEDVAGDLVARLREYERYKMAAADLKKRAWLDRDVFVRGSFLEEEVDATEKKLIGDDDFAVDMFELVKALHEVLNRLPKEENQHKVISERISVTQRIYEVLEFLKSRDSILFEDLFTEARNRVDVVISFLALLEMSKLKMVRFNQAGNFGPIRIERRIEVAADILSNDNILSSLEEYRS